MKRPRVSALAARLRRRGRLATVWRSSTRLALSGGAAVGGYASLAAGASLGRAVAGGLLQMLAAALVAGELRTLRMASVRDPLTGLYNRRQVQERLAEALAARRRRGGPAALVLLDVDDFKQVNDRGGHAAGDRVLAELARSLAAVTRRTEVLGRWGGDEFALVLPEGGARDAADAARRLQDAARAADFRVSAGWAAARAGEAAEALFARADDDLYRSKRRRPGPAGPSGVREAPGVYATIIGQGGRRPRSCRDGGRHGARLDEGARPTTCGASTPRGRRAPRSASSSCGWPGT